MHLSRELHDESGQALAGMMLNLGLLERDAEWPDLVHSHAADLKRIASEVLENLHSLAVHLRPASLDHLGLVTALQQYVAEFSRQHNIQVEFETTGLTKQRLSSEVETAVFRVVQESLTNVVSHANASRVDILLSRRNDHLAIVIEDNGVGFLPTENVLEDHLGLFGMRERIEMLKGTLAIESAPGKGTTVKVEVPSAD
jgi:signal transduction histidine kinase